MISAITIPMLTSNQKQTYEENCKKINVVDGLVSRLSKGNEEKRGRVLDSLELLRGRFFCYKYEISAIRTQKQSKYIWNLA